ncbi:MAG TPA: TonB-dependent receptor [Bacteroidales bacterium]|nr:TonB-dependent receptor [Bacteroidales bacterium]
MKKNKPFGELFYRSLKKTLLTMRIAIILMILGILQVNAKEVYSQNTRLSLNFSDAELVKVLDKIENESEFFFLYNEKLLDTERKVNITEKDQLISSILDNLFVGTDVKYTIIDRKIILAPDYLSEVVSQQQNQVSGTVTDKNGPIPGVNVVVTGTTTGAMTDLNGKYTITISPDAKSLTFTFIGMQPQVISIGTLTKIDVTMAESAIGLSEVVVIGYGSIAKKDITGSVGSIKFDQGLSSLPVVDFGQAMSGKIAGVQVINGSGRPGTSSSVQIRGMNSISAGSAPLIVIDGIQLPGYDLNSINSSDIESIEILKDAASSSIYGSRGANGVILVTTKSGKSGKPILQLNYTYSVQEVIRKMDVMNAPEYAQASIDAAQNGWIKTGGDPNAPNTIAARGNYIYTWPTALEHPETLANTDWQDLVLRIAPMHKIDLRASGGDDKTNYSISAGYVNQEGIVITSDYQKYTLNLNADTKINNFISVGGMINFLYDHENQPFNRIVEWAVQYPSIYPVYGNNGYLGGPNTVDGFENYYAVLFRPVNGHPLYKINDDIQHQRFTTIGNLFAKFKLYDGLNFRTSFNGFLNRLDDTNYAAGDHGMGDTYKTTVSFVSNMNRTLNYTWDNLLTYDKIIKGHTFNMMIGYEYNHRDFYMLSAQRRDYNNDDIHYLEAGKTIYAADDDASQTNLISYLSRLNYSYLGKYILSASFRRDGSSRFGPNNKWGNFPSFSAAWRVSDESFMKTLPAISNLKVRASYGFTGNDNFADYIWVSQMTLAKVAIGNTLANSYYPSSIENPNLEWERTKQLNLGLDLGLFDNRIILDGNIYRSISDGLLLAVPVPASSGFTSAFTNTGEVKNNGIELGLTTRNLITKLKWQTQLNFAVNRNEVTKLGKDNAPMIYSLGTAGGMQKINKVGEAMFGFYGYQYDGVYMNQAEIDADPAHYASATPGDGRYKDVNGDGVLNSSDRTIIGNYQPDFTFGLTNSFTYGNFDFSFMIQGVVGGTIYDDDAHRSMLYHEGRNYLAEINNRWRSEEDPGDGYHYKLSTKIDGYEKTVSSYWLEDGTYYRLKDVTIGYSLPKIISSKIGVSNARVFFNGANLLTISNSRVFDPENFQNNSASNSLYFGVGGGQNTYPSAKIYSFGINVEF